MAVYHAETVCGSLQTFMYFQGRSLIIWGRGENRKKKIAFAPHLNLLALKE